MTMNNFTVSHGRKENISRFFRHHIASRDVSAKWRKHFASLPAMNILMISFVFPQDTSSPRPFSFPFLVFIPTSSKAGPDTIQFRACWACRSTVIPFLWSGFWIFFSLILLAYILLNHSLHQSSFDTSLVFPIPLAWPNSAFAYWAFFTFISTYLFFT